MEPAQAPINISRTRSVREIWGHWSDTPVEQAIEYHGEYEDVNMANSSPTITQDTLNELNMTIPNSAAIESFQNDNRINQDEA